MGWRGLLRLYLSHDHKANEYICFAPLWMDEILHHFETIVKTIVLVFTGDPTHSRASERWRKMDFATIHSMPTHSETETETLSAELLPLLRQREMRDGGSLSWLDALNGLS